MAITTKLQTKYSLQKILVIVLSLGMGLWGLYDYMYKIPLLENLTRAEKGARTRRGVSDAAADVEPENVADVDGGVMSEEQKLKAQVEGKWP